MGITVGIDLGTSNSVVAWYNDGKAEALADSEGRIIHPSVIAFGYGDSVVVGHRAKQQLTFAPENTVFSAKRLIGRRFKETEVQRMRKLGALISDELLISKEKVELSASICKTDLMSESVGEFPELQGVMGGYLSQAQGFDKDIVDAIKEQYLPNGLDSAIPKKTLQYYFVNN